MSEEGKRQPRPFLKKGTRKHLSNATVRSLNQKPNVVDFADHEGMAETKINHNTLTFGKQEEEIKIQVKRNPIKQQKEQSSKQKVKQKSNSSNNSIQRKQPKENKPLAQERVASTSITSNKKKPALLQDYLGLPPSQTKKQAVQPKRTTPPATTMTAQLSRQQEELEDSEGEEFAPQQDFTATMKNPQKNQIQKATASSKTSIRPVPAKEEELNQVCFNSDSQEEEEPKIQKNPIAQSKNLKSDIPIKVKTTLNPVIYPEGKWDEQKQEQENESVQEERGPSKVLQKYYKKQAPKSQQNSMAKVQSELSLKDIPAGLKQQIINEYLVEKKSDIVKKFDELQSQFLKAKKEKQKYEEENKRLAKEREEFVKEMEEKNKEFQQKMKAETSKLTREKRYMKDQQLSGKGDWKQKNQLEDLRSKLEAAQAEKKKLKGESTREIDRLKRKLEEVTRENESLKNEIKYIEMQKIQMKSKQKMEVQSKAKETQKKLESKAKINCWEGAPSTSYIYALTDPNFSLFDLQIEQFSIQRLEHYQYYLKKMEEESELLSEQQNSEEKITRLYKNGKEEIEYINKVLKINFPPPFKFTVVNYISGDIKLIYPTGLNVYLDARSQTTEFKVCQEKVIYYFQNLGQLEMKYRHRFQGDIHELRKGGVLLRNSSVKGEERFQKRSNGQVVRVN